MLIDLDHDVPPPDPNRREHRAVALAEVIEEFKHLGFRGGGVAILEAVADLEAIGAVAVEKVEDETWLTWLGGAV